MSAIGGKADMVATPRQPGFKGPLRLRPILHDPYGDVGTCRAFKGALIVIRLVRLDAGKPHLGFAQFAKRTSDDPLLRKNIIPSHAAPSDWLGGIARTGQLWNKRKGATLGDTTLFLTTALTRGYTVLTRG